MKAEITRDVISDLWPLHKAGEASADSQRLISAYLAEDPEFQTLLQESEAIRVGMPKVALSENTQAQLIELSRERMRTIVWLVAGAIGAFVFVSMMFLGGALFFALRNS